VQGFMQKSFYCPHNENFCTLGNARHYKSDRSKHGFKDIGSLHVNFGRKESLEIKLSNATS
jgi:hypothetical protein